MRISDTNTREILVSRDQAGLVVEVKLGEAAGDGGRILRLSREEARRLAALLLFQAGRLERPRDSWVVPYPGSERKSA